MTSPLIYRRAETQAECKFGVAFMNARTGEVCLGEFEDDRNLSRLRTLLSHFPPTQMLIERGNLPSDLLNMLSTTTSGVPIESLKPGTEFLSSADLLVELETSCYFDALKPGISQEQLPETWSSKLNWPIAVVQLIDRKDPSARIIDPDHQLAGDCFGALIHYLRYCLIDRDILTLGLISEYQPLDCIQQAVSNKHFYERQKHMVLDSVTMTNLDILKNVATGTVEGSLIEQLDNCSTPFGRRLLRKWVSAPLCHPHAIKERQEAVTGLIEWGLHSSFCADLKTTLKSLPDLERLITKVHLMGTSGATEDQPESRAILFEEIIYSKRKITDFVATIKGFNVAFSFMKELRMQPIKSSLLRNLCTLASDEESSSMFPDLQEELRYFDRAFDHESAKKQGRIVPERGVDKDFDLACGQLEQVESEIDEHLLECGKEIGCRLSYWGTGRNRLQIEVPDHKLKCVPRDWQMSSQKKGFKRYRTKETTVLLARLMQAEERKDYALCHIMRRIFAKFSTHFHKFHAAVKCIAQLDCLVSLADYSCKIENAGACMPHVLSLDPTVIFHLYSFIMIHSL
ncbi:DNA mismatch repair protein msh6 [Cichlidogyrus casuarinus]|uniref:DNA mismatch repair protein msh6 n=1 Tax=Cichlidogyrus casuarinus TaxID=1844966 RepID=A0ABD2QKG8_9PLAT